MDKQNNILQIILTCTLPFILLIIFAGIFSHAELSLFNSILTILSAILFTLYINNKPIEKLYLLSNIFITILSCFIPILMSIVLIAVLFIEKNTDIIITAMILFILLICLITFYLWAIWTKGKIRKIFLVLSLQFKCYLIFY